MLILPKQPPSLAWHQQSAWRTYAQQLFGLVSRRRDFHAEFRTGELIAGVLPQQKRLIINPHLIPVPPGCRFDPGSEYGRRITLLRSILAHEAGHVAFSAAKPEGRLGWLWNALEDERMEREVIRRFPELERDLTFLGDALLLARPPASDLLGACLTWRWAWDRAGEHLNLAPELVTLWERDIRPLVERAWNARKDEVEGLARQILKLLPPEHPQEARPRPPLGADGAGMDSQCEDSDGAGERSAPPQGQRERQSSDRQPNDTEEPQPADAVPGCGAGDLPRPPEETRPPGLDPYSAQIEGHARRLSSVIAPSGRPAHRQPHRSKGQFRYERFVQGAEKCFSRRVGEDQPVPFTLRLLIDTSSSMQGAPLRSAVQAALMLCRAAHFARSQVQIIGFDTAAREVVSPGTPWRQAAPSLASLSASGGTLLAPALRLAFAAPASPLPTELTAIICDGQLNLSDVEACRGIMRGQKREVLPLLIGQGAASPGRWQALFGAALPVLEIGDLARLLFSRLTVLRARQ